MPTRRGIAERSRQALHRTPLKNLGLPRARVAQAANGSSSIPASGIALPSSRGAASARANDSGHFLERQFGHQDASSCATAIRELVQRRPKAPEKSPIDVLLPRLKYMIRKDLRSLRICLYDGTSEATSHFPHCGKANPWLIFSSD